MRQNKVPLSQETDPIERRSREAAVAREVRSQRVEARGLPQCQRCGGTTDEVDDPTLACNCAAVDAQRRARALSRLHKRRDLDGDNTDKIAP